jgi:hypothetical protein
MLGTHTSVRSLCSALRLKNVIGRGKVGALFENRRVVAEKLVIARSFFGGVRSELYTTKLTCRLSDDSKTRAVIAARPVSP